MSFSGLPVMAEKLGETFWRSIVVTFAAILLSMCAYYVHQNDVRWQENDERWREFERWKVERSDLSSQEMLEVKTRLVRIEQILLNLEKRAR